MKKSTLTVVLLAAMALLALVSGLIGCAPKRAGPTAEELFMAQLATQKEAYIAEQKDAEARVAEVIPDAIAETYKGKSILEIAEAEGHNSRLMTETLARLATAELDARESWRGFVQGSIWMANAILALGLLVAWTAQSDKRKRGR